MKTAGLKAAAFDDTASAVSERTFESAEMEGDGLRRGAFHAPQALLFRVKKRWEKTPEGRVAPLDSLGSSKGELVPAVSMLAFVGFRIGLLLASLRRLPWRGFGIAALVDSQCDDF